MQICQEAGTSPVTTEVCEYNCGKHTAISCTSSHSVDQVERPTNSNDDLTLKLSWKILNFRMEKFTKTVRHENSYIRTLASIAATIKPNELTFSQQDAVIMSEQ